MDLSWLVRARWRLVGAWMWPAFVVLAVADGVIGHALPISGGSETVIGGMIAGFVFNLIAVTAFAVGVGRLIRVRRRDLPGPIARNYAGTGGIVLVTLTAAAIGFGHHAAIVSARATMRDAATRAEAYIGDHAPAPFRADADELTTVVIQAGAVYRACAANPSGTREYCVIVKERLPANRSVVPDGSESNQNLYPELN